MVGGYMFEQGGGGVCYVWNCIGAGVWADLEERMYQRLVYLVQWNL